MKLFEIISKICGKEKEIIEKTKSHEWTKDMVSYRADV